MTVDVAEDGTVRLFGVCPLEDAEVLAQALADDPDARVDWNGCEQAHTAVVQVLMAAGPRVRGLPADPFLRDWVARWVGGLKSG
jgi:hypothetical protein